MKNILGLALGALGVVYGDIGTSPLYAINEIFFGHAGIIRDQVNVLGGISLVVWALSIIVAFKYIVFVLKADNDGEGGVFALYGLLSKKKFLAKTLMVTSLIFAAGLLYGDGIITPAISVLSAIEGLKVATPAFEPFIIPLTILILTGLFYVQKNGTHKIGAIFGPVIVLWFLAIGSLGLMQIIKTPGIFMAFNPYYAIHFLISHTLMENFLVLGSVMLVVTGGEAMYADMGHFGRKPIRLSWFAIVYPALLLNYLGQGAYLLSGQNVVLDNVFYSLVPNAFLYPMVILSTMATIIASQALISGAFSLTQQAMAFELFPFMVINHTNEEHHGQIFLPIVNWALYLGTITLVFVFKSSTALAGAYGLAVSGVMLMTTLGIYFVSRMYWKWSKAKSLLLTVPLVALESLFLIANSFKILAGGYIPLSIAIGFLILMLVWQWGTQIKDSIYQKMRKKHISDLIRIKSKVTDVTTIARSSIFMTTQFKQKKTDKMPLILEVFYDRYRELPENIIMLNVFVDKENPHMHESRYKVIKLFEEKGKGSIYSVQARFGFMEEPNVEVILESLAKHHEINFDINHKHWLIHALHKRVLFSHELDVFTKLKVVLYQFLDNNFMKADHYFGLGNDIELTVEVVPVKFGP